MKKYLTMLSLSVVAFPSLATIELSDHLSLSGLVRHLGLSRITPQRFSSTALFMMKPATIVTQPSACSLITFTRHFEHPHK